MLGSLWLKRIRGEEPGYQGKLARQVVRLDLETGLELLADRALGGLVLALLVVLVIGLASDGAVLWGLPLFMVAAGMALLLRLQIDATYLLDNRARRIDAFTHVLGVTHRHTVCRFEEIEAVGVQRQRAGLGSWDGGEGFVVVLALRDGRAYRLSDALGREDLARARAQDLARHLEVGTFM